jgi:hypothetical protein
MSFCPKTPDVDVNVFLSSPESEHNEADIRAAITIGQRKVIRRPGYLASMGQGTQKFTQKI